MATAGSSSFNLGSRLMFIFAALVVLILGGNAVVVSQFYLAHHVTDRLTGANQQLIAVLQLQANLLSLHRRLDDLSRSVDLSHLVAEAGPLRQALQEQTQQARAAISNLPPGTVVDATFLPTLDTIDVTLSSEIEAILELAKSGDRVALPPRVSKEFDPIENQTAILVNSVNDQASRELGRGVSEMRSIQHRVLVIVPITALSSFLIAAFFGWATARRFIELRLEERVDERLRIARELHDTLLQSFQAVLFRLQTAAELLPARAVEAKEVTMGAVDHVAEAIRQGRDAIQGLRSSTIESSDLADELRTLGGLAASEFSRKAVEFRVEVEGTPLALKPIVRDEIYRIAGEALRNAFRHAEATQIEVDLRYAARQLRLRVRDNGNGIDPRVLNEGAIAGHSGLPGMRERAALIGGAITLWSALKSGTEVELVVPAARVYTKARSTCRSWLAQRIAGKRAENPS